MVFPDVAAPLVLLGCGSSDSQPQNLTGLAGGGGGARRRAISGSSELMQGAKCCEKTCKMQTPSLNPSPWRLLHTPFPLEHLGSLSCLKLIGPLG